MLIGKKILLLLKLKALYLGKHSLKFFLHSCSSCSGLFETSILFNKTKQFEISLLTFLK